MGAVYAATSNQILQARANGPLSPPSCDLSKVNITAYLATIPGAPSVAAPDSKSKLLQVTIGRGVQNYTCADSTSSSTPKAIGAVANLYNASCIAANYPDVLTLLPPFALQYNTSLDNNGKIMFTEVDRCGHHYFNAASAPTFDLNDNNNGLGVLVADGKNPETKVAAPASAIKGQAASSSALNGAVAWLKLDAASGTTGNLTEVYRVDTAGGQPPATCSGQPASFSIEYAAQYWFFKAI